MAEVQHPDPQLQRIIDEVHALPRTRQTDLLGALLTDYAWSDNISFGHAVGEVCADLYSSPAHPATKDEIDSAVGFFAAADESFTAVLIAAGRQL